MMTRTLRLGALRLGVLVALSGCGHDTNPSTPTDLVPEVSGNWTGTATLTSVSDGECVGPLLQPTVGASAGVTLTIQQTGASLTGTLLSQSTQLTCSYSGSVSGSAVTLALTSCQANAVLGLHCGAGGRDIVLVASGITATVAGNALTGTQSDSWNVLVAGTSNSVGTLKSNEALSLTK